MRYLVLFVVAIVNLIFTGAVFTNINIAELAPDIIICTITSIAILEKSMIGAIMGLSCGLVLDLLFSPAMGIYAIPLFITGAILYFVLNNMNYIDRFLLPFFFAIGAYLIKELISALIANMMAYSFSFWQMLVRFILPEALMTGIFMLLVHTIMRRIYQSPSMKLKNPQEFRNFNIK